MKKPNFILFITDQHKADHLGAYGNKIVKTPNLDEIASKGWKADRFYVASPICMPNRSSLMTGRMPSVHGARHNGLALSLDSATFVEKLRDAGYQTALVGKSHLQNMTGHGPQYPRPTDRKTEGEAHHTPPGNYDQEWGPYWRNNAEHDMEMPFYGFSRVALAVDHGDQVWGHYWRWLQDNHPESARVSGPENAIPTPDLELAKCKQAWRTRVPEEHSTNAYIGLKTRELIEEYAAKDEPFFIQCSFPDPHHPFTPHGKYWDMYDPDEIDLPASFHESQKRTPPPHVAWLYEQREQSKAVKHTPALFSCTEREAREAIALNYGSITHIDAIVGEVMQTLKDQNVADNTIIIFMSDHGDYLGDHQLLWKGPVHYQSLIRTPFLWMDPSKPNDKNHTGALCSTIDVAPSVLERAGITPFNGMQGQSLLPLMAGDIAAVRDHAMVEEEGQRLLFNMPGRIRMRSVLNERYRLSVYEGAEWGELYDLQDDPMELENLWDSAQHASIKSDMLEALVKTMITHSETSPNPQALA